MERTIKQETQWKPKHHTHNIVDFTTSQPELSLHQPHMLVKPGCVWQGSGWEAMSECTLHTPGLAFPCTLPPNSIVTGYATEGAFDHVPTHLSYWNHRLSLTLSARLAKFVKSLSTKTVGATSLWSMHTSVRCVPPQESNQFELNSIN